MKRKTCLHCETYNYLRVRDKKEEQGRGQEQDGRDGEMGDDAGASQGRKTL